MVDFLYCYCLVQKVDLFAEIIILSCYCKNMTEPILRVNAEQSMWVVLQCNTVLPEMAC